MERLPLTATATEVFDQAAESNVEWWDTERDIRYDWEDWKPPVEWFWETRLPEDAGGPLEHVVFEWEEGGERRGDTVVSEERHPSSARFHEILAELGAMHDEKSKGYGTDADPLANVRSSTEWGVPAWVGGMVRGTDKVRRLQAYAQKGKLPFEDVEDAFRDLAVYAIISLVLFEQEVRSSGHLDI